MVQGGDIANGDGTGTVSIYGGEFEDEELDWREMDAAGLVCSANRGADTNGSQYARIPNQTEDRWRVGWLNTRNTGSSSLWNPALT